METIVYSISINAERGQLKHEIKEVNFIKDYGIEGDGHSGNWGRQVTCLDYDALQKSNEEHNLTMGPGEMAENVLIQGLADLDLKVGDRFQLGDSTILKVTQIGKEDHPSVVTRTYGVSLLPYIGLFCYVEEGGKVVKGDIVKKL